MANIGVIGAGAIGGSLGGLMAKGGEDVTLIDVWAEPVKVIREKGLHIDGYTEQHDIQVQVIHVDELSQLKEKFDILFVAVKGYDTEWAVKLMLPHIHHDTWVVTPQNGVNEELIAPMVGAHRTLGCVVMLSAWLTDPGRILHTRSSEIDFYVAELTGQITPRVQELGRLIGLAGGTKVIEDLWGQRWSKLAINCMANAMGGLTNISFWEARANPKSRRLILRLGAEATRVGRTLGHRLVPLSEVLRLNPSEDRFTYDDLETAAREGLPALEEAMLMERPAPGSRADQARASLHQDLLKGRKTEADYLNGYVARKGAALGVPAPYSAAAAQVIKGIEAGEFQMGLENIDRVNGIVEAAASR